MWQKCTVADDTEACRRYIKYKMWMTSASVVAQEEVRYQQQSIGQVGRRKSMDTLVLYTSVTSTASLYNSLRFTV